MAYVPYVSNNPCLNIDKVAVETLDMKRFVRFQADKKLLGCKYLPLYVVANLAASMPVPQDKALPFAGFASRIYSHIEGNILFGGVACIGKPVNGGFNSYLMVERLNLYRAYKKAGHGETAKAIRSFCIDWGRYQRSAVGYGNIVAEGDFTR